MLEIYGDDIDKTYVKIDLYSKRDVLLGTKYVKIDNFRIGETREFRMGFKFTNVSYCKVTMVDSVDKEVTEEQFTTVEFRFAKLMATIVLISLFG